MLTTVFSFTPEMHNKCYSELKLRLNTPKKLLGLRVSAYSTIGFVCEFWQMRPDLLITNKR